MKSQSRKTSRKSHEPGGGPPHRGFPGFESEAFGDGPRRGGKRGRGHPGRGPHGRGGGRRGGKRRPRISRGEVRLAVLAVLNEEPMHGYQIMQELEERSGGGWQPSPGSIYPTLQLLADEGLIISQPIDGKNVFSLTEAGATAVAESDEPPPWERFVGEGGAAFSGLKRSMFQLGAAARQVAAAGSRAQAEAANEVLNDARKALYRILAEDPVDEATDGRPAEASSAGDEHPEGDTPANS